MRNYFGCVVALLFLVSAPLPAFAAWIIDYPHSQLTFIGLEGSNAFTGSFKKFQLQVDLDPAHSDTGKISADIDIASATAGSAERDSYLPQPDWFNTAAFPTAHFESTSITKTGDLAYTADGKLTIKGITQPVSLIFTLVPEGDHWRAQGKVTLKRGDFHVGAGEWASETYVKNLVDVMFNVVATPQPEGR